jgi:uridine kinase
MSGGTGNPEHQAARLPFPPVVIAIAGCSGSGKTTLAAELAHTLGGVHFHFDNYYRDLGHMPLAERAQQNFDDPAMIEHELLAVQVRELAEGRAIDTPVYDFSTHTRAVGKSEHFAPGAYLVVEGLFALYYAELQPLYQLKVYIDTPDPLCFERRLKRDTEQRGRTPESVKLQYDATVRPSSLHWVRPTSAYADMCVDGNDALDWKLEQVLTELRRRGLMAAGS